MKRSLRYLAVVLVAMLALTGVAVAHTISFPTSITVSRDPSGAVERGTTVRIFGKLSSDKRNCYRNSKIKLIRVGTGVIRTTRTDGRGRYEFFLTVRRTARYRVRFPGKVLNAVHPHLHTCEASSAGFRIRVR